MEINNEKISELLLFQIRRKITSIYKNFFFIIEDLQDSGYNIPDEQYQKIRKRILDSSNDAIREIEDQLSKYCVSLK
jgi:hypothetical protein